MANPRIISVRAKPNARVSALTASATEGGSWLAQLKSPPVDGKANQELIRLVAEAFGCRKNRVVIKAGASGRMKLVQISSG